ncbi:DNA polymerase III subunit gamma and tau [Nonomuraea rhodomycinica]|uniref:DNA polymerase III subunit gamma/tau n=1 Tax=Nonomuraea rhodomycinica TaxID=1712872 RepID=A0A7Y6ME85_9ACTN|nr:DNA polymerase III subunit gamma and tau [Nonomuraea rhodomycinica]NUW44627.1 DNA polymerase III subunit gamma and tau [Nonomuraea rhodomycinica]
MSLALYRRYRPGTFAEVKGQEHVTDPLRQALRTGRINHAYLFSGPRGCGKTSSARILARSLNCEKGPTPDPCGVCESCVALAPTGPGHLDVIEIDAASHGGVDDARDLRERAFFAPVSARYKIYIIDEAHMVTREGFNALLKLVEEPPPHLKFIFATTEPEKVIGTIKSRTHHYPFRLMPPATLRALLEEILTSENVPFEPNALPLVVRAGAGSARDSLSILDQLLAGADDDGITYAKAVSLLGYTDGDLLDEIINAFAARDGARVFHTVNRVIEGGHDPRRFAADLLERFRDLVILANVPEAASSGLLDRPADELERLVQQAGSMGPAELTRAAEVFNAGLTEMRGATSPRLLLELMCARVLLPGAAQGEEALLARLERLERGGTLAAMAARSGAPVLGSAMGTAGQGGVPGTAGHGGVPGAAGHGAVPGMAAQGGSFGPGAPAVPGAAASVMPAAHPGSAGDAPDAGGPASDAAGVAGQSAGGGHAAAGGGHAAAGSGQGGAVAGGHAGSGGGQPGAMAGGAVGGGAVAGAGGAAQEDDGWPETVRPGAPAQQAPGHGQPGAPGHAAQGAPAGAHPTGQTGGHAPAAQPGAGGGSGLALLQQQWPAVLAALKQRSIVVWANVSTNAQVVGIEGNLVTLGFSQVGAMKNFTGGGKDAVVAAALGDVLGNTWRVEAVVGGSPAAGGSRGPAGGPPSGPARPQSQPVPQQPAAPVSHAPGGPGSHAQSGRTGSHGSSHDGAGAQESGDSGAPGAPPALQGGPAQQGAPGQASGGHGRQTTDESWPEAPDDPGMGSPPTPDPTDTSPARNGGSWGAEPGPQGGALAAAGLASGGTAGPGAPANGTAGSGAAGSGAVGPGLAAARSAARAAAQAGPRAPGARPASAWPETVPSRSKVSESDDVDPLNDANADVDELSGMALLQRELGATVIGEIDHA